jgi:hypothetical protein
MSPCSNCGIEYADNLTVCPECGTPRDVFRCERCDEEFTNADACPACGKARVAFTCELHPENQAEGRCVVCGRAVCEQCDHGDGRVNLCAEHSTTVVIEGWAQVYTTTSEFEARLLRDNLLAEGIDAQIFSQKDNMLSVDLGELSIVRVLVPVWEFEHAGSVIQSHMDFEGEVTFACPSCGEAYEPGATQCLSCGAALATGRSE